MNKLIFVLLSVVVLGGCATSKTVDDFISNKSTKKGVLFFPIGYQKAYRLLSDQSRKCLQQASVGNENVTGEKLDTDIKMGVVTLTSHNAIMGQNVMGHFIVEPGSGKDTTKLTVYAPSGLNQYADVQRQIEWWMTGQTACYPPPKTPHKAKGPA